MKEGMTEKMRNDLRRATKDLKSVPSGSFGGFLKKIGHSIGKMR
jgi:hypothetical protein